MEKISQHLARRKEAFPSLKHLGFAVEHFPNYVNRRCTPHSVDVVLLSVIMRGRGRHIMDGEIFQETGGSLAVTHYGQMHDIVTDARGMEIYNVYLDLHNHPLPTLPASLSPTLSSILPLHPRLQHHLNRRIWIRVGEPGRLAASLARIKEETNSLQPGALEIAQHSFQIFLMDVCREALRNGLVPLGADNGSFPAWVEQLRLRLDQGFAEPHSLDELARDARVSVAYLCRHFKTYTGKTVIEYLIERRIHAAIWKLRDGNEKILPIALSCGFNDLAYFNRTFKNIVGTTPSAFRNRIREGVGG